MLSKIFYQTNVTIPDVEHMLISNGVKLYTKRNLCAAPKAVIVIVHGLAEHLDRYDYLANYLQRRNFAIYRYDQRGHGRSAGERGAYTDFNNFADDVKNVVAWARSENQHLPIFVLGHSMGGGSVMAFGTKYPNYVKGIISISALTRYNAHIMGDKIKHDPEESVPNALGDGVNTSKYVTDDYANDPLNLKQLRGSILNAMFDLTDYLKQNAKKFIDPVLIIHGAADGVVSPLDSVQSWNEIGSTDKELHIYPHLMHEVLNEPSRKHDIYQEIVTWITNHIA
ncbi:MULTISPECIES: alpha/beta hydrolase [Lactobacillaceae]|jgi:lysophospholipase|nr:alpha/beta hydrolase [Loigolactobacillus coryniformis]MBW4803821.1 lysophospholipase [Loigolactobacillus coryniformis subsp. torquens]MBW4806515.1 lysophospholipase [Loigolactobacillus coryniformis subsp. torquens]